MSLNLSTLSWLDELFVDMKSTTTRAGWCLRQGLEHVIRVGDEPLALLIARHGLSKFYSCCRKHQTVNPREPTTCFQSLCRIVVGQFVSGHSAKAVWKRLWEVTNDKLTPQTILNLVERDSDIQKKLQEPVGTTFRKAATILELARQFANGQLSEEVLTSNSEEEVRKRLLQVKGIGPWSCDMFLLFYLERPNVLPMGDLGVRKGLQRQFSVTVPKATTSKRVPASLEIYQPYWSLVSYYMWRVVDTPAAVVLDHESNDSTSPRRKKQKTNAKMVSP